MGTFPKTVKMELKNEKTTHFPVGLARDNLFCRS